LEWLCSLAIGAFKVIESSKIFGTRHFQPLSFWQLLL